MSIDRYDTDTWSRPLLPSVVEAQLLRVLARSAGLVLMALCFAGAVALVSWRFPEAARTAFGMLPGAWPRTMATGGGWLLETFGLAAFAVLLVLFAWGLELVARADLARYRPKMMLFPLATALIAGGVAALPTPQAWSLSHGLGGGVGTVTLAVATTLAAAVGPRDAVWISGLVLLAAGAASLTHVIGLSVSELARATLPIRRSVFVRRGPGIRPLSEFRFRSADEPTLEHANRPSRTPGSEERTARHPARHGGSRLRSTDQGHTGQPTLPDRTMTRSTDSSARYGPYAPPPPFDPMADLDEPILPVDALPSSIDREPREESELDMAGEAAAVPSDQPLEIYHGDGADSAVHRIESARLAGRFAPALADDATVSHAGRASAIATVNALVRGVAEPSYRRPSLTLLGRSEGRKIPAQLGQAALRGTARLLLDALADFEVKGLIRSMRAGPVVTVLEFDPAPGVRSDRLLALGPDVARVMGIASARVALVPGRSTVTFELPNVTRDPIALRDILETPQFRQPGLVLPIAAGRTITGEPVVLDLARLPHVLIVGSAAARPQGTLDTIVLSQLFRHGPADCRMLLIDPRVADLSVYNGIPHLVAPVVTQPAQALAALAWVVAETEERMKRLALLNARSLDVYNNRVRNARKRGERNGRTVQTGYEPVSGRQIFEQETFEAEPMPHLVVVLGELADVLMADRPGVEGALQRIARVGATVGVHMVAATDRPTTDVLTPEIKRAFASRLCLKLPSRHASGLAIEIEGAEHLLAEGDMLVLDAVGTIARIHSAVASDADVEAVVAAVLASSDQRTPVEPIDFGIVQVLQPERGGADDLYDRAVAAVLRERRATPEALQRRLGIDRHHALALLDRMQRDGLKA